MRYVSKNVWEKRQANKSTKYNLVDRLSIAHIERFLSKIEKGNCWIVRSKSSQRYITYQTHLAHRLSYELFIGFIPLNMTVDHLCENKHCVKPTHLELVTASENAKRYNSAHKSNKALHIAALQHN